MKKKLFISFLMGLLAMCLALMAVACKGNADGVKIELNQTSLALNVGGSSGTIRATVEGSTEYVTWEITDANVASITALNNTCIVKPLSEGSATLSAKIGDAEATCAVTVGAAVEVEVVTISKDGEALAEGANLSVEKGGTITLTASGSKGSSINWTSSNTSVASVDNGVVTAERPGTAVITAYVTPSVKATCTVTVTASEGSEYYDLQFAAEGATEDAEGKAITQDKFFYWSAKAEWGQQEVAVGYAYYEDGVISFAYTSDWDPGYSYGFQLFYKNSAHTLYNNYKLTCKITVDQACKVTLNGNIIDLQKGENNVTVYYRYTDPLGSGTTYGISSFDLTMGYADGTATGSFVKDAAVSVSDIAWEEDVPEQLAPPSFSYNTANGVITIQNPNAAGVGGYRLNFYDAENKNIGSVAAVNGEAIDTSRLPDGTYTVRLIAVADSAHYIDSEPSADSATVTVKNVGGVSYTLDKNNGGSDAVANPGEWTYWTESWVEFQGEYSNNQLTVTFGNNTGNWYDTQLFYQQPGAENGKVYEITLKIDSTAAGKVTVGGTVVTLEAGAQTYKVTVSQTGSATLQIIFGTAEQGNNNQDIQSATVSIEIISVKEAEIPAGAVSFGEEATAVANVGTFYYWNDQGWGGSNVSVSAAREENGVVTLTYSGATDGCWFGMQLFYKNGALTPNGEYILTLKINASVAGNITVNGTVVALHAGENTVSVSYTEEEDKASLSIQFGTETPAGVIAEGTFAVSDISVSPNPEPEDLESLHH